MFDILVSHHCMLGVSNQMHRLQLGVFSDLGLTLQYVLSKFLLLLFDFSILIKTLCMQASVAKLETSVSLHSDKLEFKVYGFNDKLPVILSRVLSITKSFVPRDDRFKVCTELYTACLASSCVHTIPFSFHI